MHKRCEKCTQVHATASLQLKIAHSTALHSIAPHSNFYSPHIRILSQQPFLSAAWGYAALIYWPSDARKPPYLIGHAKVSRTMQRAIVAVVVILVILVAILGEEWLEAVPEAMSDDVGKKVAFCQQGPPTDAHMTARLLAVLGQPGLSFTSSFSHSFTHSSIHSLTSACLLVVHDKI